MAWFDGTFDENEEELKKEFPVEVMPDLRLSEDKTKLAIINHFETGTKYFDLSDPKSEEDDLGEHVFIHSFFGEEAGVARKVIEEFVAGGYEKADGRNISLFRQEPDNLFMYSHGHICEGLLHEQETLRRELSVEGEAFLLPLKRYMFKCPVCGHRTLQYRGMFDICLECGWEDEGIDGDDQEPGFGPNGDYTIREYRTEYLKLKAEDPNYTWWSDVQSGDGSSDEEEEQ